MLPFTTFVEDAAELQEGQQAGLLLQINDFIMKIFCLFLSDDGVRLGLNWFATCVFTVAYRVVVNKKLIPPA